MGNLPLTPAKPPAPASEAERSSSSEARSKHADMPLGIPLAVRVRDTVATTRMASGAGKRSEG